MGISVDIIEPGTIGTYDDLVAKVADWLDRDDLTSRIPDFISILEARLNRLLRTVLQGTSNTLWTVAGEFFALPADFRKLRSAKTYGPPHRRIYEVAPSALPACSQSDAAIAYSIEGRMLRFSPIPSTENPLTLDVNYWKRIAPLGTDQPVNWVLTEHPDIYVWGTLHQAAIYIRDPEAIDACGALLDQAIGELRQMSRNDQWGGPLAPRGVSQVRGARC